MHFALWLALIMSFLPGLSSVLAISSSLCSQSLIVILPFWHSPQSSPQTWIKLHFPIILVITATELFLSSWLRFFFSIFFFFKHLLGCLIFFAGTLLVDVFKTGNFKCSPTIRKKQTKTLVIYLSLPKMIDKCGGILRWKINSCQFDFQLGIIMINEYDSLLALLKKLQIARLDTWGQTGAMNRNLSICSNKLLDPNTELVRADDLAAATFLSAD